MSGIGLGKDLAVISFHKDYGDYAAYMKDVKEAASSKMRAYVDAEDIESFLIDLNYQHHYQPLTFSGIAAHLRTKDNNEKE